MRANAARITEFIAVAKGAALIAKRTNLNTLLASLTAALANHRASTAKSAGLAKAGIYVYGTVLAHAAIRAIFFPVARAAVTSAFGTNIYAVFTGFRTVHTDHRACSAKIAGFAIAAVRKGTIHTDSAINAMGITIACRAVAAALGANVCAIAADLPAVLTDLRTVAAKSTGSTIAAVGKGAIHANSAIRTTIISIAFGAVTSAVGADHTALLAGFSTGFAKRHALPAGRAIFAKSELILRAIAADAAVYANTTVCFGTVGADSAKLTELCTVFTVFLTFRTDHRTIHTSVSAGTNHHAISAVVALIAPAVSFATLLANFTIGTEVVITVIAVLPAIRADHRTAIASVSAGTDVICTLVAGVAVFTEILFSAHTVYTGITSPANILICAVGTFFKTALANRCTFRAAVSTVTDIFYTVTAIATLCAPAVTIGTVHASVAVSAEVIVAVVAVLPAVFTNECTFRATAAAIADGFHAVSANVAVVTPAVVSHAPLAKSAVCT